MLALLACTSPEPPADEPQDTAPVEVPVPDGPPAPVAGTAWSFSASSGRIPGGTVEVYEVPGLTTETDADGNYTLDVPTGGSVSMRFTHPDFAPVQTATLPHDPAGLGGVDFQVPDWEMVELLAAFADAEMEPDRCQLASTVLRPPGNEYEIEDAEGEPGVVVTIDPPLPAEHGPIYFQIATATMIWPDPTLTETTEDGGVLFLNVPEGVYTLAAHKDGMTFTARVMTCRAGWIVNAGPPLALTAE